MRETFLLPHPLSSSLIFTFFFSDPESDPGTTIETPNHDKDKTAVVVTFTEDEDDEHVDIHALKGKLV